MPVAMRDLPRPARLSRSFISVSFVLRWIVTVRGMLLSPAFGEALDQFEDALHLVLLPDTDADVAGGDVSAVAQDNFLFGKVGDEIGSSGAEIDENEISGTRVCLESERVQFLLEPRPRPQNVFHIARHRLGVVNGGFRGYQRREVRRERCGGATKDGE